VRRRPNLRIVTGAEVARLSFAGKRATGVIFRQEGTAYHARAGGEVVLAAGAIGTPKILELSGIGRADILKPLGIDMVQDAQSVGENLADHLQIRTIFRITGARTLNDWYASALGKLRIGLDYALKRSGPLAMAPSQFGIFTRSAPEHETPNIEYHVQPLSLDVFGQPLHRFPALTVSVCNLRPESRGSVHVTTADPGKPPAIRPNYLSAPADQRVAVDSIRHARALMATKRMAEFQPVEIKPGPAVDGEAALLQAAGDISTTIFHPVSTARMGVDDGAVVSPELTVNGIAGLSIADASVMPTITSGNTHAPVTMIAEKAAEMIIARLRG